jgi:predicted nucleotidyltransferase
MTSSGVGKGARLARAALVREAVAEPIQIARNVAQRLSRIEGIVAVALGGSLARGTADEASDIDLGIYYDPAHPFSVRALADVAREIDDRRLPNLMTGFGEWGPWVNGGGWLIIGRRHLDLLYRDLDRVRAAIAECRAGRVTCHYQLGHPHGFYNHMYMGEVHYCIPVHDPDGVLEGLKESTAEYPEALRGALIGKHMFDADFELAIAEKPAARGDVYYAAGCLFRSVGFLVQVLYALNRRYFVNEKGAMREVESFALKPQDFSGLAAQALGAVGMTRDQISAAIGTVRSLIQATRELCAGIQAQPPQVQ